MPVVDAAVDATLSGCPAKYTERCAELDDRYGEAAAKVRDALVALEAIAAELEHLQEEWTDAD